MGMYGERMARGVIRQENSPEYLQEMERRSRRARWSAPGVARVVHPDHGAVVVPCGSKFAAILCAAEVWRCNWAKINDAEVWAAPGEKPVAMPFIL